MRGAALLCVLAGAVLGCARPYAPPGGERDLVSPRLVGTSPEPLAVVPPGNQPAIFRFNEKISERGFSEALVSVSPQDSTLRVERSGSEVRVRIDGGWRPDRVYRIVLLRGIRDLFGNERREQVELVFSTGAPVVSTALAGIVTDRLTAEPVQGAIVNATHLTANARYTAITDSVGFYSLRYLPLGEYEISAYEDRNNNRRRDALEPVDSGYSATFGEPTDTVALIFSVLSPDTTPPRITNVRALDSLHVHVEVDDFFDPAAGLASAAAEVLILPDSSRYTGGVEFIPEPVFTAAQEALARQRAIEEARLADTTAAADTAGGVPADTLGGVAPAADPLADGASGNVTLPIREFIIVLERPLAPGSYLINVGGITNLHGLTGGGIDDMTVSEPPPPAPPAEPPPPDTSDGR